MQKVELEILTVEDENPRAHQMLFVIKFEQVLGVIEDNFSQKGGKMYLRHGLREAFS